MTGSQADPVEAKWRPPRSVTVTFTALVMRDSWSMVERNARLVEYLAWHLGAGYALVGETERALAWLDHAANMGFVNYPFLLADPLLEPIRGEPGFGLLAERVKRDWEAFEV